MNLLRHAVLLLTAQRYYAQSSACDESSIQSCQAYNRQCANNFTTSADCGYCLENYIEINSVCYAIDAFNTDAMDDLFTYLLEEYLPDFASNETSREERVNRFISMAQIISAQNLNGTDFELGINNETLLTVKERQRRLGVRSDLVYDKKGEFGRFQMNNVRASRKGGRRVLQQAVVDWHETGFTTRVKNQGLCGCCWAVAIAAAIESALLITNQTKITNTYDKSVSFQQMITCDMNNLGCDGGNILYATKYVWKNDNFGNNYGGLVSYSDYPFEDYLGIESQTCNIYDKTPKVYLNYPKVVTSVNDRTSFEERRDLVMAAVSQQPVTTTMKSQCDIISLYKRGVITTDSGCECCEASCIDHAVVLVGFDTTDEIPFWKVRNSWGGTWGEAGHFRVAMNDPGCGWGLFGILAESALMEDAYSTLEALPERPGWWETAKGYQKVLLVVGSLLGFICFTSVIMSWVRKYNYDRKRASKIMKATTQKDETNETSLENDGKVKLPGANVNK